MSIVVMVGELLDLEQRVDADITAFEKWFCENVDQSSPRLSGPGRAIIKSYLWYKTHPGEKPNG